MEAVILILKGGKIEILEGVGVTFKEPKSQGGGPKTGQPPAPKEKDRSDLPLVLADDIKTSKFKHTEIIIYGDQTCGSLVMIDPYRPIRDVVHSTVTMY